MILRVFRSTASLFHFYFFWVDVLTAAQNENTQTANHIKQKGLFALKGGVLKLGELWSCAHMPSQMQLELLCNPETFF